MRQIKYFNERVLLQSNDITVIYFRGLYGNSINFYLFRSIQSINPKNIN